MDDAVFAIVARAQLPALLPELRLVPDAWLGGWREKRFSVGCFDPDYLARSNGANVRIDGTLVAFANIWAAVAGDFAA